MIPKPLAFLLKSERCFNGLKFTGFHVQFLHNVTKVIKELCDAEAATINPNTVTYGRICLRSRSTRGSTGTSCGGRSSQPVCRRFCRWFWKNRREQSCLERTAAEPGKGESAASPPTCGGGIGWRCAGPSTALLSRGRTDVSRTLWLKWWSWKPKQDVVQTFSYKECIRSPFGFISVTCLSLKMQSFILALHFERKRCEKSTD